jgi:hypothetical protein
MKPHKKNIIDYVTVRVSLRIYAHTTANKIQIGRLLFQSGEEQGDLGRGIWGGGRTESAGCWGGRRPVSSGCGGGGRRRTLAGGARTVQGEGRRENARTRGAELGGDEIKKNEMFSFITSGRWVIFYPKSS